MSSTVGPQPGPSADPAARPRSGPVPAPSEPDQDPGERRRQGLRRSTRDMVLSVLVIVAFVAAIVALVPRPNAQPIRNVDVAGAAAGATGKVSFTPALPQGLPSGWVATSADVRNSGDGLVTWHIGYLTPEGHYASIEQVTKAIGQWESIMDSGGTLKARVVVDGTSWEQRYTSVRDVTALIHRGTERTTMVTSKGGGLADAEVLARSIPASQR